MSKLIPLRLENHTHSTFRRKMSITQVMRKIPKLSAFAAILVIALGTCSFFLLRNLPADQLAFARTVNQTSLHTTTTRVRTEMEIRLTELGTFIPRVFSAKPNLARKKEDFFADLRPQLRDELAAVTFLRRTATKTEIFRQYRNQRIFKQRHLGNEALASLFETRPIPMDQFQNNKKMILMNRSSRVTGTKGEIELNLITIVMDGAFIAGAPPDMVVAIDLLPEFLRSILRQSKIARAFLLLSDGKIFCHLDPEVTRKYSNLPMPHPAVTRIAVGAIPPESEEMMVEGSGYYVASAKVGFDTLFAVSQTKKDDPLVILRLLMGKNMGLAAAGLMLALLILSATALILRRPRNQRTEAPAASAAPDKRTVSRPPMTTRKTETAPAAEKPASTPDAVHTEQSRAQLYFPGAESPSALAGGKQIENRIEFFIGEVRPAELPKPLIRDALERTQTALTEAAAQNLGPGDTLSHCNSSLHQAFRGRLFLTLAIGRLDLVTGKLEIATAGHPPPLRFMPVRNTELSADKDVKRQIEVLLARGERLGTKAEVGYPSVVYQLEPGDRLLAFTQGAVEAKNRKGEPWGTEGIAGAFLSGVESGGGLAKVAGGLETHVTGGLPRGDWAILWLEWNERAALPTQLAGAETGTEQGAEAIAPETRQDYLYARPTAADDETEASLKEAA